MEMIPGIVVMVMLYLAPVAAFILIIKLVTRLVTAAERLATAAETIARNGGPK